MSYYVARSDDHLARIAHRHGLAPADIWGHAENAALARARGDGSVLRAGDLVFLPEPPARERQTISAGSTKTFHAQIARVPLRLRLADGGRAIAGEPWELVTPGETLRGTTGGDGLVDARVRVTTRRAELVLPRRGTVFAVDVGALDPIDRVSGVQMRLCHLGHYVGEITGALDEATRAALGRFQASRGLSRTGEADDETVRALLDAHGR